MIFNIQRYSTHDGPGIRTVVFLKGCSLGCRWCQNPESRARTQDLLFDARLCLEGCELCVKAAPGVIERALNGLLIHREKLTDAHLTRLTDCCPTQALTVCGEVKSVDEIMTTVLRDKPFMTAAAAVLRFRAANRLCNQNWPRRCLKPATRRAFIPQLKPVCMCRGNTLNLHCPGSICSLQI